MGEGEIDPEKKETSCGIWSKRNCGELASGKTLAQA
jgi:hypothetical protein